MVKSSPCSTAAGERTGNCDVFRTGSDICLHCRIRKFPVTTDSDQAELIFPELGRDFVPICPDQLWVAGITCIRLRSEFVFLAVLNTAVSNRRSGSSLIHHSDRGNQYAAKQYRDCLKKLVIQGSMSHKGNPYDNAQQNASCRP